MGRRHRTSSEYNMEALPLVWRGIEKQIIMPSVCMEEQQFFGVHKA
jgi:hypothetical protein